MRLPRLFSPQMHRRIDLVAFPSVIAAVAWMSRRDRGRRASDHRLPARFPPLDELPRPRMGGHPAQHPSRVARAAGAGHPGAGSARPARACFDAARSERAERHAGTVAPFMMPRRPMTSRIGCGGTTGNAVRFRRVFEKVHSRLLSEYRASYLGMPICSNAPLLVREPPDGRPRGSTLSHLEV